MLGEVDHLAIFPATHFVTNDDHMEVAIAKIQDELEEQLAIFEKEGKLLEAQRLKQRTEYDIEMLREMGYTNGVENYSRHMDGRSEGEPPYTLLDFFPDDFLIMIDESHMTMGQIKGICTMETVLVRKCWLIMVSVCHQLWTIVLSVGGV